jgi:hypothetical protein
MTPPWTFPAGFASWGIITCAITTLLSLTFLPSKVSPATEYADYRYHYTLKWSLSLRNV